MTILDQQNTAIQKLCASHKVKTLYAFGSTVTNHFNANSDVDLVVDFEPIAVEEYADNYFDLKFSLQDILERPIDLLEAQAIKNPFFKQAISQNRRLVYEH